MPYFPPAPGGSILLPNTVDDVILTDMAAGTLKGRALGAGTGDPQALTGVQARVLLAIPPVAQCRLNWLDNNTLRLDRCNGMYLTCDDKPCAIPAAGIVFSHAGNSDGAWYIWAYGDGVNVTALAMSTDVPVIDPRNGMLKHPTQPVMTYVGCINRFGGMAEDSITVRHVSSYYNRTRRTMQYFQSNSTVSTTDVPLHNPIRWITEAFSPVQIVFSGFLTNTGAQQTSVVNILLGGVAQNCSVLASNLPASAYVPIAVSYIDIPSAGISANNAQMGGHVTGGQMTLNGQIHAVV